MAAAIVAAIVPTISDHGAGVGAESLVMEDIRAHRDIMHPIRRSVVVCCGLSVAACLFQTRGCPAAALGCGPSLGRPPGGFSCHA